LGQAQPAIGAAVSFTGPGRLIGGVQSPSLFLEALIEFPIRQAIDVRLALRFPPSLQLSVLLTLPMKLGALELYAGAGVGIFPLGEVRPSLHQLLGVRFRPQGFEVFSELVLEEVLRPRPPGGLLFALQLRLGALMRF